MLGARSARSSRSSGMNSLLRVLPCPTVNPKSRCVCGGGGEGAAPVNTATVVWSWPLGQSTKHAANTSQPPQSIWLCCLRNKHASSNTLTMSHNPPQVISRSGDECVVALTDQWYLTYGEEEWAAVTTTALQAMRTYSPEVQHGFEHTLGWLKQWACSRSFGLGTRLPWDPQYLIESLSDSTIYMAYYTVAHLLQGGDMYGRAPAPAVAAEDVTDAVWDFVLLGKPAPAECGIAPAMLERMRQEFEFWYPFDLRVSGKDLIQNHLTFCLYNHTAIWPDRSMWPKGMRCNGHLQLNGEKMSKSTGNFKTLEQAVQEYSADAMRVCVLCVYVM